MKMVQKTWENVFNFHNLAGILVLTLVTAFVYLRRDINWDIFNEQIILKREQTVPIFNEQIILEREQTARCDYFSGRWVHDNVSYPLYKEINCPFVEDRHACGKYGRKDSKYQQWRWQPNHCDIPRFNGAALLEKLRGKKLVFVGDSLMRNQWMSMLCLIHSSHPPSSYKLPTITGNWHLYQQNEYNTTIAFYWSPFLVESNCDDEWRYRGEGRVIKVNSIENHGQHWVDTDVLIFDTFTWWVATYQGSFGSFDSTYYLQPEMKQRRFEIALSTWSNWLEINVNWTKTRVFFMGASPFIYYPIGSGYRGDDVGRCYNKTEPLEKEGNFSASHQDMIRIQKSIVEKMETRGLKVKYLPITEMSELRIDGYTSIYKKFEYKITQEQKKYPTGYADCVHWCLPGVPDIWNQIIYAHIINS